MLAKIAFFLYINTLTIMNQIIDWNILSSNPVAIELLHMNIERIDWNVLSGGLYQYGNYDYKYMQETKRALHRDLFEHHYYPRIEIERELMEHHFHPAKLEQYLEMHGSIDGYLGYDC